MPKAPKTIASLRQPSDPAQAGRPPSKWRSARQEVRLDNGATPGGNIYHWKTSHRREKLLRQLDKGEKKMSKPFPKLLESGRLVGTNPTEDELEIVYYIAKGFDQHVIAFQELKENLRFNLQHGRDLPQKQTLAELCVQTIFSARVLLAF
ncbi:hypothetical protein BMF94_1206 [Rhodotorula taiwanensis]|uniref:Uncharacterized protein n=1 Tax=Rhodotorula taiwanensis TaxID=741276 RepID=A0A2S5BFN8_9BASI|nr:hypothetical protein BMF94_1206 [Rhodotorula taiwanensis]